MNCDRVRNWSGAYRDSELDAANTQRVLDHLASCPACREWFEAETRFDERLFARLRRGERTEKLWEAQEAAVIAAFAQKGRLNRPRTEATEPSEWPWWIGLRQWLWPHPGFYGALAALWALMLSAHVLMREPGGNPPAREASARPPLDVRLALAEQRRQFRDLLAANETETEPPAPTAPKPQSEGPRPTPSAVRHQVHAAG